MQNKEPTKSSFCDSKWSAIDIFVFSNGQQYSPPRKYHLQAEDIELWKSTLAFLARTQYGPYHSTIDLFTIRGRKVTNPLELCNGESYVAVQPPDCFIHAGYDKYLLKACRSWEKRQAKKFDTTIETECIADNPEALTFTGTALVVESNIKSGQATAVLEKLSSHATTQDTCAVIKPSLTAASRQNSQLVAKQTERRKSSLQAPFFVRKLTPTLLPTPSLRNPFKRNESIKSINNVKSTKPDVPKNSSTSSSQSAANAYKTSAKAKVTRPAGKSKGAPMRSSIVLPRLAEIVNELTSPTNNELASTNNEIIIKSKTDLTNAITDKNLLLIPSLEEYENPRKEMASISMNPYPKNSIVYEPMRQNATTTVLAQYINTSSNPSNIDTVPEKEESSNIFDTQESIKINHNVVPTDHDNKIFNEQSSTEQSLNEVSTKAKENIEEKNNFPKVYETDGNRNVPLDKYNTKIESNIVNDTFLPDIYDKDLPSIDKLNIDTISESIKRTMSKLLEPNVPFGGNIQETTPRKRSVTIEPPGKNQNAPKVVDILDNNHDKVLSYSGNNNETLEMYNSSHQKTLITSDTLIESQSISKGNKVLTPQVTDNIVSDQFKTTLKKGDVVNLKLNIQIDTREGIPKKNDDSLKSQSVTFIQTEKESHNVIDDNIIVQNKSLLSLIGKELKNKHTGDNQKIIIVQCGTCKYCNDNTLVLDKDLQKNYILLLPIEKLEAQAETCRCHCGDGKPDLDDLRIKSVTKPSGSCISLGKVSKNTTEVDDTTSRSIFFADPKSNDNVVTVVRKKSVAINEELIMPYGRDPSTLTQEVDIKSELIEISVTSSTGILARNLNVDVSTQTDWCDTLLEAKLLSNGHYSFHLPSLEMLKGYKLT